MFVTGVRGTEETTWRIDNRWPEERQALRRHAEHRRYAVLAAAVLDLETRMVGAVLDMAGKPISGLFAETDDSGAFEAVDDAAGWPGTVATAQSATACAAPSGPRMRRPHRHWFGRREVPGSPSG